MILIPFPVACALPAVLCCGTPEVTKATQGIEPSRAVVYRHSLANNREIAIYCVYHKARLQEIGLSESDLRNAGRARCVLIEAMPLVLAGDAISESEFAERIAEIEKSIKATPAAMKAYADLEKKGQAWLVHLDLRNGKVEKQFGSFEHPPQRDEKKKDGPAEAAAPNAPTNDSATVLTSPESGSRSEKRSSEWR